jgi:hypothetical protein
MKSKVFVLILGFILASCTHSPSKKSADKGSPDIDDAILGTWIQKDVECADKDTTPEGNELSTAFRIGMSAAKVVVTSDKSFWDVKEYKDVENPDDFCQVSVDEKWTTKGNQLTIADSDEVASGNGKVNCERKFKRKGSRNYTYEVTEKSMTIHLGSPKEYLVGDQEKEEPLCKSSEVVIHFQRDSSDE